jgi:hypothetical protein
MLGDRDGLIRVPAAVVEATENLVRKAILAGIDPQQAYLRFGKV